MKKILILFSLVFWVNTHFFAQCNGGSSFASVAAPTSTSTTTISSCNWAGDYNTITSVVSGSNYTLTSSPSACITIHSGSPSGTVVAYGSGSVTFTAPSSGTYYMTLNSNCSGCGTGTTCLTTTITCNSCGTGPCASVANIGGCGQVYTLSTSGSSSFVSSLCATSTPGLESVYSYTATSTGSYSFDISSVSGGGYAIGYQTSASGCGATGWTCVGSYTSPTTSATMSLTSGTTYYFIFDATSTASSSINFMLNCPAGGPTTAGDCPVAANVCSNAAFSIDPNGYGSTDEICIAGTCASNPAINPASTNSGCLLSGELNSTWMVINILTGGSLTFSMGTPNSGTFNCLDWSMWPYNSSACSGISGGTLAPVRCNYNGSCEEFTGLASSLPSGASSMTNWEPPITVASSTQYIICLSNYSSAQTTVPLSFGGTAVVSCSPLGVEDVSLTGVSEDGLNKLRWTTSHELNANHFEIERSDDGINYSTISQNQASGFTLDEHDYFFDDAESERLNSYYRIKLVHDNGSFLYSNQIVVTSAANFSGILKTFPNPVESVLNVVAESDNDQSGELKLLSPDGTILTKQEIQLLRGTNYFSVPTTGFSGGVYFLALVQEDRVVATQKIVIK